VFLVAGAGHGGEKAYNLIAAISVSSSLFLTDKTYDFNLI
jgi:hypothetical protein